MKKFAFVLSAFGVLVAVPSSATAIDIMTKTGKISAPPADKGQVVFFRTGGTGALLGCTVREDDAELARLGVGKYYVVPLNPGIHQFTTKSIESKDKLRVEVEAGETYFVKCSISMGFFAGHPKLTPSDEKSFAAKAAGMKSWDGGDKDDQSEASATGTEAAPSSN